MTDDIHQTLVDKANERKLGHVEVVENNDVTVIVVCDYESETVRAPEGETLAAVSVHQDDDDRYLVQAGEGTGRGYDVTTEVDVVSDLDEGMDLAEEIVTGQREVSQ